MIQDISNSGTQILIRHDRCADEDCVDCAADYLVALVQAMQDKQDYEPFGHFILSLAVLAKALSNEERQRIN